MTSLCQALAKIFATKINNYNFASKVNELEQGILNFYSNYAASGSEIDFSIGVPSVCV